MYKSVGHFSPAGGFHNGAQSFMAITRSSYSASYKQPGTWAVGRAVEIACHRRGRRKYGAQSLRVGVPPRSSAASPTVARPCHRCAHKCTSSPLSLAGGCASLWLPVHGSGWPPCQTRQTLVVLMANRRLLAHTGGSLCPWQCKWALRPTSDILTGITLVPGHWVGGGGSRGSVTPPTPTARGPILVRTRPQRGGVPPPPPLQTPKWLYRTMGFVGARGAGDFVLGIWQGEIFLFDPMCLSVCLYSELCGEFKNG